MSQVFIRSEQLAKKVFDVKLYMNEWKVLFALDGKMSSENIVDFLGIDQQQVDNAINRLTEFELVSPGEGTEVKEEAEVVTGEDVQAEEGIPPEQEEAPESVTEQTEPEQLTFEGLEEEGQKEETDFGEEIIQDTDLFEEQDTEEEPKEEAVEEQVSAQEEKEAAAEELVQEGFEELKLEEESAEKLEEGEQDLDRLINDLLKEETAGEETGTSEEPKILGEEEMAAFDNQQPDIDQEQPQESEQQEETQPEQQEEIQAETLTSPEVGEPAQALDEVQIDTQEQPEVEEPQEIEAQPEIEKPVPSESQKSILVVDDSIVIRKMVEIALENENYNVITVSTGKEAFSFLDERDPNLVILDIMLPDVNGLDILKAIKARKDIPVVMLSAKDTPKETSKAQELGANDFIPKPFRDDELISKIHNLIGE